MKFQRATIETIPAWHLPSDHDLKRLSSEHTVGVYRKFPHKAQEYLLEQGSLVYVQDSPPGLVDLGESKSATYVLENGLVAIMKVSLLREGLDLNPLFGAPNTKIVLGGYSSLDDAIKNLHQGNILTRLVEDGRSST